MDFLNYNNYYNLPEYNGKNTFYVTSLFLKVFTIAYSVFIVTPLILLLYFGFGHFPPFALLSIALFLIMGIGSFGHLAALNFGKVIVNEQGISIINIFGKTIKHFDWDNIENIHVLISLTNYKSNFKFYISTDPLKICGFDPLIRYGIMGAYTASSPEYMILHYKPQIIHCIIKYWNNKIDNYDAPPSWQRYINKL